MKSLKKTLALVLVCAMVFGLMGVASASSASFTDTTKTTYGEAISVLTGIGVIAGTTTTTFDPTGSLTREQAAKIITYLMLGSTNASLLSGATSTTYKDVASDRWSAGYISYCTNLGVLAGNGDGTFNPTGALTSCAWSKMLLCALGYKADLEGYTGASWAINVAADAVTAGINDSTIALSSTTAIDREQACQMAFKTLTATEVYYTTSGTTITIGGTTVVTGASAASNVVANGATLNYNAAASTDSAYATMQFCEGHFSTLKLTSPNDSFGRPSNKWTFGTTNATIAQVASTPALTYTTSFYPTAAYKALVNAGYSFSTTTGATIPIYINGFTYPTAYPVASFTATTVSTTTNPLSGNGVCYSFYANSNNVITSISVINSAPAKVSAYKADDTTTATVDERTLTMTVSGIGTLTAYANAGTNSAASNYATTGFDAVYATAVAGLTAGVDVYVMAVPEMNATTGAYTLNALGIAFPKSASGAFTSYSSGSSLTIGGTIYSYAKIQGIDTALLTSANVTSGINVTVMLDTYGYAVGLKATTTASNYAYVLNAATGIANQAQLLLNDGTVIVVTTKTSYTSLIGDLVTYSASTASVYTLTAMAPGTTASAGTALTVSTGASAMNLGGTTVYANSNTIFLIATNDGANGYTYAAYKGIANVPSYIGKVAGTGTPVIPATSVAYGLDTTYPTIADVVFIKDAAAAGVTTSTGTYIFDDASAKITDSTGTYYVYKAVVNGAVSTVKVDPSVVASSGTATTTTLGLYGNLLSSVTYTNGIITALSDYTGFSASTGTGFTGTATAMLSNGVIGLGGTYYGYSSTAVVFYVTKNADGSFTITASSIAGVATDTNDTFYALKNSSGVLTALYIFSI